MVKKVIEYDDLVITYYGELDDSGRVDIFDISVDGEHDYSENEIKDIIYNDIGVDDWGYIIKKYED